MGCLLSKPLVEEPAEQDPRRWGHADVAQWLASIGLQKYQRQFVAVDGQILLGVAPEQLRLKVGDEWDLMCLEGGLRKLRARLPPSVETTTSSSTIAKPRPNATPPQPASAADSSHSVAQPTDTNQTQPPPPPPPELVDDALDPILSTHPKRWTPPQVGLWLTCVGLGEYRAAFKAVSGRALLHLDEARLKRRVLDEFDLFCFQEALADLREMWVPPSAGAQPSAVRMSMAERRHSLRLGSVVQQVEVARGGDPASWSRQEVAGWMAAEGLEGHTEALKAVTGQVLLQLTEEQLRRKLSDPVDAFCMWEALKRLKASTGAIPVQRQVSAWLAASAHPPGPATTNTTSALSVDQDGELSDATAAADPSDIRLSVPQSRPESASERSVEERADVGGGTAYSDGGHSSATQSYVREVKFDPVEASAASVTTAGRQPERGCAAAAVAPSAQGRVSYEGIRAAKFQAGLAAVLNTTSNRGTTTAAAAAAPVPPPQPSPQAAQPRTAPPTAQTPFLTNHNAANAAVLASLAAAPHQQPQQRPHPPASHNMAAQAEAALAAVRLAASGAGAPVAGSSSPERRHSEEEEGSEGGSSTESSASCPGGTTGSAMVAAVMARLAGVLVEGEEKPAWMYFPVGLGSGLREWWEGAFGARDVRWGEFKAAAASAMAATTSGMPKAARARLPAPETLVEGVWADALGLRALGVDSISADALVGAAHLLHFQRQCEEWATGGRGQGGARAPTSVHDHLGVMLWRSDALAGAAAEGREALSKLAERMRPAAATERFCLAAAAPQECREWLLQKFDGWLESGRHRILALHGSPGQGKSALLCALASCRPASVAALHLCRFQDASRNAPRAVLTSIVFQLARNIPTLRPILSQVLAKQADLSSLTVRHLFEGLLLYPLLQLEGQQQQRAAPSPQSPVVVLLHGLHHCGDDEVGETGTSSASPALPALLPRWLSLLPCWVRFVITLTPDSKAGLALAGREDVRAVRLSAGRCRSAIATEAAAALRAHGALSDDGCEAAASAVSSRSGGSLLYGAAKLRDLAHMARAEPEEAVLAELPHLPKGLTGLWAEAVRCLRMEGVLGTSSENVVALLSVMAAARQPLPLPALPKIVDCDREKLDEALSPLKGLFLLAKPSEGVQMVAWPHHTLFSSFQEAGALDVMGGHRRLGEWAEAEIQAVALRSPTTSVSLALADAAPYVLRHALSHCLARITPSTAQPGPMERAGRDELHRMASLLGNLALLKGQYELGRGFTFCREARLLLSRLIDASGESSGEEAGALARAVCEGDETLRFLAASNATLQQNPGALIREALSCPAGSAPRRHAVELVTSAAFDASDLTFWRNAPSAFPPQRMLLQGHTARVLCVAVLPDGVTCVSGSEDKTIRVWDLESGETLHTLRGHTHSIRALAATSDGRWLASGGQDGCARVWDLLGGGGGVEVLPVGAEWATAVAWLPDTAPTLTATLAIATSSGAVLLWTPALTGDVAAQESARNAVRVLKGHEGCVMCLQPMAGGRLASGSADRSIIIWDTGSGRIQHTLRGHGDAVRGLTLLPCGDDETGREAAVGPAARLVSCSADGTLRLWEAETGSCRAIPAHSSWVNSVEALRDGRLVTASDDESIRVWSASGELQHVLTGHQHFVRQVVRCRRTGQLLSCADDHSLRLWDVLCDGGGGAAATRERAPGHSRPINAVALLPDGRLVSGGCDGRLLLWTTTGQLQAEWGAVEVDGWVTALLPLGAALLAVASYKLIHVWDVTSAERVAVLEGHTAMVTSLAVLPDGRLLSGSTDEDLRLWDMTTFTCARRFKGQVEVPGIRNYWRDHRVHAVAVLPAGSGWAANNRTLVASGASDKTIRLWNADDDGDVPVTVLHGHSGAVLALASVRCGALLVSGSEDNTVRVWQPGAPKAVAVLEGHGGWVNCLAISPDQALLATGSDDKTVRVWDTATWTEVRVLRGHSGKVNALAAVEDGRILSGGADKCLFLWSPHAAAPACLHAAPSLVKFVDMAPAAVLSLLPAPR